MPTQISENIEFNGGFGHVVAITEEEMAAAKPAIDQLLEMTNGDPAIALMMVAHYLDIAVAYICREDVEGILGFAISEEEWPAMKEQLAHYDEHVVVCNGPLTHVFVRDCYDKLHQVNDWQNYPPLRGLVEAAKLRKWQLVG